MVHAQDLDRAGQTAARAGDHHGQHHVAADADAAVARGAVGRAGGAHFEADRRLPHEQVHEQRDQQGDENAGVEAHALVKGGEDLVDAREPLARAELDGLRVAGAARDSGIEQRHAQAVGVKLRGNVVEHDGGQQLAHAEAGLEQARKRAPAGAAQHAEEQNRRERQRARQLGVQREDDRQQQTHDHLALAADVHDAAAVGHADAHADNGQRRHDVDDAGEVLERGEGIAEDDPEGLEHVRAQHRQDEGSDTERQQHGEQDDARGVHQFEMLHISFTPAIIMPSLRCVASPRPSVR